VSTNVERILAFLAIRERPQHRSTVAATLWIDTTGDRAAANLRTALWKARQAVEGVIAADAHRLSLRPCVDVDLSRLMAQAGRLIDPEAPLRSEDANRALLMGDLLPEWDEHWIMFERERVRQMRVHALDALCRKLSALDRAAEAIDAGLAAVDAEPLRESAQGALIAAHLKEGNLSEARRQYLGYRSLLWDQMSVEPSPELRALVGFS
jgi:DNA-binding SARP family transcriptional activator